MKTVAILEAEIPSGVKGRPGRKIVLRELTGEDELACAAEASGESGADNLRYQWAQVMRTLESVDGKPFDASAHTPESTRALFSAHDWALVVDAFSELNRAKNDEVKSFRATFRLSARDAG